MKKTVGLVVLSSLFVFIVLAAAPFVARGASGPAYAAATSTRWPTVTRRPSDTRWPTRPANTRWPTATRRLTDTRWPSPTPRPTDTRWLNPTPRPTGTSWSANPTLRPTDTRWPSPTPRPTNTRWPTATPGPALSMGPYGVVLVNSSDALNIRSGPGTGYTVVGTFGYEAKNVMRSGSILTTGGATWYGVHNPLGGTGWVNSYYLSEAVSSETFCSDGRIQSLVSQLTQAANTSDGALFAALVSPTHGLRVHYWHYQQPVYYTRATASGVFTSTIQQNWGGGPSGMDTIGTFAAVVQPSLLDVLTASYEAHCNHPKAAAMFSEPWPGEYTNFNYYSLFRPGTPGVDLDYGQWMVAFDYVRGQPYLVAMIRVVWEP